MNETRRTFRGQRVYWSIGLKQMHNIPFVPKGSILRSAYVCLCVNTEAIYYQLRPRQRSIVPCIAAGLAAAGAGERRCRRARPTLPDWASDAGTCRSRSLSMLAAGRCYNNRRKERAFHASQGGGRTRCSMVSEPACQRVWAST